jgi:hypothetical protein
MELFARVKLPEKIKNALMELDSAFKYHRLDTPSLVMKKETLETFGIELLPGQWLHYGDLRIIEGPVFPVSAFEAELAKFKPKEGQ